MKPVVINHSFYQLVTLILMKHLEEFSDFCQDELISGRMSELTQQHNKIQDYRELNDEYDKLIAAIAAVDDKEQRDSKVGDLDDLIVARMCEAEQFCYLAGLNDARRVFEISRGKEEG
jgi:hypothetical protein